MVPSRRKPGWKASQAPHATLRAVGLPLDEVGWEAHPAAWMALRRRMETTPPAPLTGPAVQVQPDGPHRLASVDQMEWEAVVLEPERQEPSLARGEASVATSARRLMALERSRARRAKPAYMARRSRAGRYAGPGIGHTGSGLS